MRFVDYLDRRFRRYGVPNLTIYLIGCQVLTYVFTQGNPALLERLVFIPALVFEGEVWRLFTFLAVIPGMHPIFAFFFWYLFYLMGTALEVQWGAFRYNLFLLIGYLATLGAAMLTPYAPAAPTFLQGSVYLAFAFLYPDFVLQIFFIFPVKIKWLALLTWIGYFFIIVVGDWPTRFIVLASIANFLVFFGQDLIVRARTGHRRMVQQASHLPRRDKPFHQCTVCGITDRTHPDMDFRYCTQCHGQRGYCTEHIFNHEHVRPDIEQS